MGSSAGAALTAATGEEGWARSRVTSLAARPMSCEAAAAASSGCTYECRAAVVSIGRPKRVEVLQKWQPAHSTQVGRLHMVGVWDADNFQLAQQH